MTIELGRVVRLSAGLAVGIAMAASGSAGAYAAAGTTGVAHFFDCLGELGNSAEHAANCGAVNSAPVPGGLSVPVHDGNFTCPVVGMAINYGRQVVVASLEMSPSYERDARSSIVVANNCPPPDPCQQSSLTTIEGFNAVQIASIGDWAGYVPSRVPGMLLAGC